MIGGRNAGPDATSRAALKFLRAEFPALAEVDASATVVERPGATDPPRLTSSESIEHSKTRAVTVEAPAARDRSSAFRGFLDGTQRVQILGYRNGAPFVLGTVSAAIRSREERKLATWKGRAPAIERRLYVPFSDRGARAFGTRDGFEVVELATAESGADSDATHQLALVDRAVQLVGDHREALEYGFAQAWCATEASPLFIDGGISGYSTVAGSPLAIGVIKSHRTLYADGAALRVIVGLEKHQRSSVFRISPHGRASVASWYVRLRSAAGHDPLWGLVRIEIADTSGAVERADEITRWVIAESAPLALPDGRWDKMAYGIRDAEEFLRAVS